MIKEIAPLLLNYKQSVKTIISANDKVEKQRKKIEELEADAKKVKKSLSDTIRRKVINSIEDPVVRKFLRLSTYNCEQEKVLIDKTVFAEIFGLHTSVKDKVHIGYTYSSYHFFYIKPTQLNKIGVSPSKKAMEVFFNKVLESTNKTVEIGFEEVRTLSYWGRHQGEFIFLRGRCKIGEVFDIK